jgi:hypothetical protein
MAFSPYASYIWWWVSTGFTFLAFKKWLNTLTIPMTL